MKYLKKLVATVFVTVVLVAATVLMFGGGTMAVTVSAADLPLGLTESEWQQIDRRLAGGDQEVKLTADDVQAYDDFGRSVAISGDTMVVGAWGEDGGPGDPLIGAGAVYVFERDQGGGGAWGQAAKLTAGDAQANDHFGWSVAISGDTIVVGAVGEDGGPADPLNNAGAAYVFDRDQGGGSAWGQVAKLTASDTQDLDNFGRSVAISNATIVVGANWENGGPGDPLPFSGAAYIFEQDQGGPGAWGQVVKLTADDTQAGDEFGFSVALSGDTIVVSARNEDGGPGDPQPQVGAAYVFNRNQGGVGNWGQVAKLIATDSQTGDFFGWSVAISGETIAVGAWYEDGGPGDPLPNSGAAYIFERDQGGPGAWGQVAKLAADDAQAYDLFGSFVGISGDMVVVGAWEEDGGQGDPLTSTGAAYVFEREQGGSGVWGQVEKLTASDAQENDIFGTSVAVSSETIVVGAPGEDGGLGDPLPDAGAAYVFGGDFDTLIYLPAIIDE